MPFHLAPRVTWRGQNRGHAYLRGLELGKLFIFFQKHFLRSGDLINVVGTEILRSVPEIMDLELEKNPHPVLQALSLNEM